MYDVIETTNVPIKAWTNGVPVEDSARQQLINVAALPFIHKHVAVMPDVHFGRGATVGSVIATKGAIIPAAVGVDIGCGMMAVQTTLTASDLPEAQLGTLGGGNHFIEICLDTEQTVWVMLHSGSRGIGNIIGQHFIALARQDMQRHFINLPDRDLA